MTSADCTESEIIQAQIFDRFFVDEQNCSYVYFKY